MCGYPTSGILPGDSCVSRTAEVTDSATYTTCDWHDPEASCHKGENAQRVHSAIEDWLWQRRETWRAVVNSPERRGRQEAVRSARGLR